MDRVLPNIPNEIYLDILGYIAPSTGILTPEQHQIFSDLSCVCRFFANLCLPRVFESIEFSGSIFRDTMPSWLRNDTTFKTSRESTLCAQIAANQPLALSLAQTVKICRFTDWKTNTAGAWALRIFSKKYLAAMVHMKSIHQLTFSDSFVDSEYWDAMATLPLLQELSFERCSFRAGPADVEPEKRVMLKVSRLQVTECPEIRQPFSVVDPRSLRTLVVDSKVLYHGDWISQFAVTELRICPWYIVGRRPSFMAPPSVETLWLSLEPVWLVPIIDVGWLR